MAEKKRKHCGHLIYECEWAGNPHGGKWVIQTRPYGSGMPWADEHCPHYHTLDAARRAIDEWSLYQY